MKPGEKTAAEMFRAQNPDDYAPERIRQRELEEAKAAEPDPSKRFWTKLIKIDEDKNDPQANALVSVQRQNLLDLFPPI